MDSELAQASSHGMGRMSAVVHNIPPKKLPLAAAQVKRWQPKITRAGNIPTLLPQKIYLITAISHLWHSVQIELPQVAEIDLIKSQNFSSCTMPSVMERKTRLQHLKSEPLLCEAILGRDASGKVLIASGLKCIFS